MKQIHTQVRISDYLQVIKSATAQEISDALGLTKSDIQYHIKSMRLAGKIIQSERNRLPGSRGRSTNHYELSRTDNPYNVRKLASSLLGTFQNHQLIYNKMINEVAWRLYPIPNKMSETLSTRITEIIEYLALHNYQAKWEIHKDGPIFIITNCPFASLVNDFCLLCEIDRILLFNLFNTNSKHAIDIQFLSKKKTSCSFLLKTRL